MLTPVCVARRLRLQGGAIYGHQKYCSQNEKSQFREGKFAGEGTDSTFGAAQACLYMHRAHHSIVVGGKFQWEGRRGTWLS